MKKLPKELQSTITFSQLNLKWNKSTNSYMSVGQLALGSVGKVILNKLVDGHVELKKKAHGGDVLNIYIELDPMHWYFFSYTNNLLSTISSNVDYNNLIQNAKPDKREQKTDKGKFSYQIGSTTQKTIFLRHFDNSGNGDSQ